MRGAGSPIPHAGSRQLQERLAYKKIAPHFGRAAGALLSRKGQAQHHFKTH